MQLRPANADDLPAIAQLVQAGFIEHVAPDWDLSAQQEFLRDTTVEKLAAPIAEATFATVYEHETQLLGIGVTFQSARGCAGFSHPPHGQVASFAASIRGVRVGLAEAVVREQPVTAARCCSSSFGLVGAAY